MGSLFNTDSLAERLRKVDLNTQVGNTYDALAEEAVNWATEIVSAAMLEKCCCKNEEVECYFCKLTHEVLKKLEEK